MTKEQALQNMNDFEVKWFEKYLINWCTQAQLQRLVELGRITEPNYTVMIIYKEQQKSQQQINAIESEITEA